MTPVAPPKIRRDAYPFEPWAGQTRVKLTGFHMRNLAIPTAAALLLVAAPCQAQDWLSGIARGVAQSAAERLVERAVTTVTQGAVASGQTGAEGMAAPTTGGRPENYDANGDRIYRIRDHGPQRFGGQAVWRSAAQCAALNQLVEIHVADWQAKAASRNAVYPQNRIDTARASAAEAVERFRSFAVKRLRIDHPASDAQGRFDEEVARQTAALQQEDWSVHRSWDRREEECDSFYSSQRGLIYDMEAGRGEGSNPAPAV